MTSLGVVVAAYGSCDAASADWDDFELVPVGKFNVIDAALIERFDHRVTTLHRFSASGWAHGAAASALIGLLWPPSLLDGAIAGGVGSRALTFMSEGLSRDAVNALGRVMESERFVTVALLERTMEPTPAGYGARALSVANLPMSGNVYALRHAVDADEADDADC